MLARHLNTANPQLLSPAATPAVPLASRRQFLKASAAAGAGLVIAFAVAGGSRLARAAGAVADGVATPNAFLRIAPDNTVTVLIKHIEFGQGTFTGLSTLVAEELDADWAQIRAEHAPADATLYNNLSWGPVQGTGGSSSIANSYQQMREAGAMARALLVKAAAEAWGVAPGEIAVAKGVVSHAGGDRPFLLWFGAGYDAIVIDALNTERTGFMGIAGLVRKSPAVFRALHRYRAPDITIRNGGSVEETAASVILANVAQMAFGGTTSPAADPCDGRLDLLAAPRAGTAGVAVMAFRMLTSSLAQAAGVRHSQTTRVTLEAEGDVPFHLDGEPVGMLPVEVGLEPAAVRLLIA